MTMELGFYELPALKYQYNALAPLISEEQLKVHHTKHHQAYVDNVNNALKKWDAARKEGTDLDLKAFLKDYAFNLGGHVLHTAFWENLAPPGKGGDSPLGVLADAITRDFGSFDRFKKMFSQAAISVEGSGWAVLTFSKQTGRLGLMQLEKHNVNIVPDSPILLVLDVWEHAYYIDYKNLRAKFVEAFWGIVDWDTVGVRFEKAR
jgi:Fe-Mn family superoxide dismutase